MIWIIGGTSEGREIVDRISDLDNFLVSVATDDAREFIRAKKLFVGRMDYDQMKAFALDHQVSLIVDLTHPYAKIVSKNAKELAKNLKIDYIRYIRSKTNIGNAGHIFNSYQEAYDYLKDIKGTVFFTTGSKNIKDFEKVRGENRFIYRVLPARESLDICKENNIQMRDIIAVLGPFSKDFNMAMLKEYRPDYCIMKNSGHKGGTLEKIQACQELNIIPLVIGREDEDGINNLDDIEKIIRRVGK